MGVGARLNLPRGLYFGIAGSTLLGALSAAALICAGRSAAETGLPSSPTSVVEHRLQCKDAAKPIAAGEASEGEPSLRSVPADPRRALAVWTRGQKPYQGDSAVRGSVVLGQRDRHGIWSQQMIAEGQGDLFYGKATLDFGPRGLAYFSYLSSVGTVALHRVVPGLPADADLKPPIGSEQALTVAVDQRRFLQGDRVYVVNDYGLRESRDGGKSWGSLVPAGRDMIAPTVATGGDHVLISWRRLASSVMSVASYDTAQQQITHKARIPTRVPITDFKPFGAYTLPSLTVVRTGQHRGIAYLTWADKETTDAQPDVYATASFDGMHWSEPLRVNDDGDASSFQIYPSVAAMGNGGAIIAWLDSRNSVLSRLSPTSAQLFSAVVRVAGSVEAPEIKVSKNRQLTTCPSYDESYYPPADSTYGDYFNFDASHGKADLIFPQIREPGGDADIYGRIVDS